ncbi:hypothetical protein FB451DRAFT_621628 [Mycena latifolia]|nr:hypothetical protein FB451DRAFT_621628 [Mycena latifolia]
MNPSDAHPDDAHDHEHDAPFAPLQLKGEVMDLEFTLDTDHRKRRRNRTTQSCLNCHTSKRKCDRKRPCQRCIQLGLTGLCVYEIDDPALRDDPSVDENTRLRNRIAELESLVRELRGKPHPRWADSTFRDGDPNEKWHSRATKCAPLPLAHKQRRAHSPSSASTSPTALSSLSSSHMSSSHPYGGGHHGGGGGGHPPALLPPIKTEGAVGALYRFTASNAHPEFDYPHTADGAGHLPAMPAHHDGRYHNGDSRYRTYAGCPCRANPAMAHAYIALAHALQGALKHPPQAPGAQGCLLFRRVADLASLMQGTDPTDPAGPAYDGGNTPTDSASDVLTPLSSSAGTNGSGGASAASFHSGSPGTYHPSPPGGYHASASSSSPGSGAGAYHPASPGGAYHTNSPGAYHASSPGAYHTGSPGAYHPGSPGYHPASPGAYPPSPGPAAAYAPSGGGGASGGSPEWERTLGGGYNPYFPIPGGPGEHGMYGAHVIA